MKSELPVGKQMYVITTNLQTVLAEVFPCGACIAEVDGEWGVGRFVDTTNVHGLTEAFEVEIWFAGETPAREHLRAVVGHPRLRFPSR